VHSGYFRRVFNDLSSLLPFHFSSRPSLHFPGDFSRSIAEIEILARLLREEEEDQRRTDRAVPSTLSTTFRCENAGLRPVRVCISPAKFKLCTRGNTSLPTARATFNTLAAARSLAKYDNQPALSFANGKMDNSVRSRCSSPLECLMHSAKEEIKLANRGQRHVRC
jgi:hypothetical protein